MERQKMSDADGARFLASMEKRISDRKVIELIKEDIEFGLTQAEIEDYAGRNLKYDQRKAISEMHRREYPGKVIGLIGATNIEGGRMRFAMNLYEQKVSIDKIKEVLEHTKTEREMRRVFDKALKEAQVVLATVPEKSGQEPPKAEEVADLSEIVKQLTEMVRSHTESFGLIAEMQKKMEAVQRDEAVTKNLTELNERLDKENRELSEQLGGKQDEVAKGLQTISKLRDEVEKQAKEIDRLKSHIKKLEDEKMAMGKAAGETNAGQTERPDSTDKKESGDGQEKALSTAQTVQPDTPPDGQGEKKGASHEEHMEIPIGYTMTLKKDGKVVVQSEVEPVIRRKPSAWQTIMGRFAFPKKSQQNFVQMIIKKELSPEQVNEIKQGLAKGLNEEQMDLIINKDLTPERIRSIVEFAVLQNSLNAERGCVA